MFWYQKDDFVSDPLTLFLFHQRELCTYIFFTVDCINYIWCSAVKNVSTWFVLVRQRQWWGIGYRVIFLISEHVKKYDKPVSIHFNSKGHSIDDFRFAEIEISRKNSTIYRQTRESLFIKMCNTQQEGLNKRK